MIAFTDDAFFDQEVTATYFKREPEIFVCIISQLWITELGKSERCLFGPRFGEGAQGLVINYAD